MVYSRSTTGRCVIAAAAAAAEQKGVVTVERWGRVSSVIVTTHLNSMTLNATCCAARGELMCLGSHNINSMDNW